MASSIVNAQLDVYNVLTGSQVNGAILTVDSSAPLGVAFRDPSWTAPDSNPVVVNADLDKFGYLRGSFTNGFVLKTDSSSPIGLSFLSKGSVPTGTAIANGDLDIYGTLNTSQAANKRLTVNPATATKLSWEVAGAIAYNS